MRDRMKRWARTKILNIAAEAQPPRSTMPPSWQGFAYYEAAVQLVVRSLVKPGDLVFDVGANLGGISLCAAEAVGPYGRVVAVEPSPRALPELYLNLQAWHATNVSVIPKAAWSKSREIITFYFGEGHYADSVFARSGETAPSHHAETIALDDLVSQVGRAPDFVKFDIEGAEMDALKGFEKTILSAYPTLILETYTPDEALAAWLVERGYRLFLVEDFEPYRPGPDDARVANIVAVHTNNAAVLASVSAIRSELVSKGGVSGWQTDSQGAYMDLGLLEPGRYCLRLDNLAEKAANDFSMADMIIETTEPYKLHNLHIATWSLLAKVSRCIPFHLDRPSHAFFRIKRRPLDAIEQTVKAVELHRLVPGPRGKLWT